jgi:hypothetical protein
MKTALSILAFNTKGEERLPFRGNFEIRWNNGYWKIRNMHNYVDCERFRSLNEALDALWAN